jgi:hypothetical protein
MGLLRKKINSTKAHDFFMEMYSRMISPNVGDTNREVIHDLRQDFPLLRHASSQTFSKYMTAASIAWLDIAWTKYAFKHGVKILDIGEFKRSIEDDLDKVKPGPWGDPTLQFTELNELAEIYGASFGSSYTNGNTIMAELFVQDLMGEQHFALASKQKPDELERIILSISRLFVSQYDMYSQIIKKHHLLH